MQDTYGNAQDYLVTRLDTILVRVTGQEFSIPFSYPSATASLTFATAGNYSLEVWLESPKLAPSQLVASYTLTVVPAPASAAYAKVYDLCLEVERLLLGCCNYLLGYVSV